MSSPLLALERYVFPGHTAKVKQRLEGVIGPEAAQAGGEYSSWRVTSSWFALLTIGLSGWAEAIGGHVPRVLAVVSGLLLLYAAVAGVRAASRMGKLAQRYVAERYGVDLRGTGAGAWASGWERVIDRARKKGWST
jgi:hypothetical protein